MRAALLLCAGCAATPDPRATTPTDHLTADALRDATTAFTDLGPRLVTTPAEALAAERVAVLLGAAGVDAVERAPFTWDAWVPGPATVEVGGEIFAAEPLSPSPSTDGLTGVLARGDGDFDGQVALFSSDDGSRAGQFIEAVFGGADAFIRVTEDTDDDGALLVEVGHTLQGSPLPAVAVDRDAGRALRRAVGEAVTLTIEADVVEGHTSDNVVARVDGEGDEVVYVTAHYDSWHPSESAFDNALGVGGLVLLARQLAAGPRPARDVVFLATSGEEQGLRGAIAWVEAHEDEAADAALVITLDVLWSGEGPFWLMATDSDWLDVAAEAAREEGLDGLDGGAPSVASDHAPFMGRGAPAVWCTRQPDPRYHTDADTLDRLDLDEAAAALRSQWRILAAAAGVPGD